MGKFKQKINYNIFSSLSENSLKIISPILYNHLEKNITNLNLLELFNHDGIIKELDKIETLISSNEKHKIKEIIKEILDKEPLYRVIKESGHIIIGNMVEEPQINESLTKNSIANSIIRMITQKKFPYPKITNGKKYHLAGIVNEELLNGEEKMNPEEFREFITRKNTINKRRERLSADINNAISLTPQNSDLIKILYEEYEHTRILLKPHFYTSSLLSLIALNREFIYYSAEREVY